MNTPQRQRVGVLIGLGVIGVLAAGKAMPSKKQTVCLGDWWGVG